MRDTRKNLKYTKTSVLKAIVNNRYRGADGFDYVDYIDTIDAILWKRSELDVEIATKNRLKSMQDVHNMHCETLDMLKAYHKTFGDSKGLRIEIKKAMAEYENFCNAI